MIYLYSGTPGSGKSLHSIRDIKFKLEHGGNVISNFPVAIERIKNKGNFVYLENKNLTVPFLMDYAVKNHVRGKENQTLLVIDEAQALFNPREYTRADRKEYNHFFSIHRHIGYNVILITQNDRLLDRQIRCLLEYEIKHRKINNFKTIGQLLPLKTFACIRYWYGVNEKIDTSFFVYTKKLGRLYDSYRLFELLEEEKKKALARTGTRSGVWGSLVVDQAE